MVPVSPTEIIVVVMIALLLFGRPLTTSLPVPHINWRRIRAVFVNALCPLRRIIFLP